MNQIVRVFSTFEGADSARKELLAEGFDRAGIEIAVTSDEAGPGQGNFLVGDTPSVKGGTDYKDVFAPHAHGTAHCVMTVGAADAAQSERAAVILARHGAHDIDVARDPPGATDPGHAST
ncbi:hypothetical protein [Massilia sp. Se16.2.3]|uniref:hypothetical protein n=1 Tax=Massilia sp. Se16.2.3 TaxID=2709303 RepID=UPI00160206EC|nr:hypothetical protein [Massilia sp. Se16.2.3]QNB00379.1 hypothetical protein G4G31_18750 [Massilia sp. Se16.2.3]